MQKNIIRRIIQFVPVLLGITFLAFSLIYMSPSDPVSVRLSAGGISADPVLVEKMTREMGLDRPFFVQYGDWLFRFLQGDMGSSYITDESVSSMILRALPYTLKMAAASLILTLMIACTTG